MSPPSVKAVASAVPLAALIDASVIPNAVALVSLQEAETTTFCSV
jgi:hypothetical protein